MSAQHLRVEDKVLYALGCIAISAPSKIASREQVFSLGLFMRSFLSRGIIQECFELIQLKVSINRSEELHMFYNPTEDNARREGSPSTPNTTTSLMIHTNKTCKPSELPLISPLQQNNSRTDVKKEICFHVKI